MLVTAAIPVASSQHQRDLKLPPPLYRSDNSIFFNLSASSITVSIGLPCGFKNITVGLCVLAFLIDR